MLDRSVPIVGYIPSSLNEWRGKISAVIFTHGCSLLCPFCHAPELVLGGPPPEEDIISIDSLLETIKDDPFVNGIVVTGGEPLIHDGISSLLNALRETGKSIRLATNGMNFCSLGNILLDGLVDSVALDIKTHFFPEKDYSQLVRIPRAVRASYCVRKSLSRIIEAGIDLEMRTTVVYHPDGPGSLHSKGHILDIAEYLADQGLESPWVLQPFRPGNCLTESMNYQPPTPLGLLLEWVEDVREIYPPAEVRGMAVPEICSEDYFPYDPSEE